MINFKAIYFDVLKIACQRNWVFLNPKLNVEEGDCVNKRNFMIPIVDTPCRRQTKQFGKVARRKIKKIETASVIDLR